MDLQVHSFMIGVLAGVAVPSAYFIIRQMYKNKQKKTEKDNTNDCILISPSVNPYRCLRSQSKNCENLSCSYCNLQKLIKVLKGAKHNLSICVYLITSKDLTDIIVMLHRKGVRVRVITDKQMSEEAQNSKTIVFLSNYIPLKVVETKYIMHNKFVLVDDELLITGSFNWTVHGMNYNFENAVILSNSHVVGKFVEYFETLWNTSCINYKSV